MMDYFNGTDVGINIIFERDGEPFIPDVGSVKYTVYDHTGIPLSGLEDIEVTTTTSTFSVDVVVPANQNTIDPERKFERRTIIVTATTNGQHHRQVVIYRLVPFLNHSVEPHQVRGFIGVQEKELPDEDIDLFSAYLYVEKDFTTERLNEALASGTTQELAANTCIMLKAVLDVLPSVRQRIAQKETNGPIGFDRVTITDFDEVERAAQARYYSAKMEALGLIETSFSIVLVTQDADPITGA